MPIEQPPARIGIAVAHPSTLRGLVSVQTAISVGGGVCLQRPPRQRFGPGTHILRDGVQLVERRRGRQRPRLHLIGHGRHPVQARLQPNALLGDIELALGLHRGAQLPEGGQVLADRPLLIAPGLPPALGHGQQVGGVGDGVVEGVECGGPNLEPLGIRLAVPLEPLGPAGLPEVVESPGQLGVTVLEPGETGQDLSAVGVVGGNETGLDLGALVVGGDLGVVAPGSGEGLPCIAAPHEHHNPQREAADCSDPGDDDRCGIGGDRTPYDVGGAGGHPLDAGRPQALTEGVLARVLDFLLNGQVDFDVLAEIAAGPSALRRDPEDDRAVRPIVGVGGADPLRVVLARVGQHRAVEIVVVAGIQGDDDEFHVFAETQVLQGGGGSVVLEHVGLVVDLHGGRMRLPEGPEGQQRHPAHEQEDDDDLEGQGRDGAGAAPADQCVVHRLNGSRPPLRAGRPAWGELPG